MIGVHKPTESIMNIMAADRQMLINHSVALDGTSFDSLGWVDLPIMMQQEEHPSLTVRKRCADTANVLRERCYNSQPMAPSKCEPLSFGWSDFPIAIEQQVFSKKRTNPTSKQNTTTPRCSSSSHSPLVGNSSMVSSCTNVKTPTIPIRAVPAERLSQFAWTDFLIVTTQPKQQQRSVQFSNVRIRNHSICLGDHPLCEDYPLSLDWAHDTTEEVLTVDAYEAQRSRRRRQQHSATKLDSDARRSRLAEALGGESVADALEAERTAMPPVGVLPRVRRVMLAADHATHWP